MATPPGNASSQRRDTARTDTRRVRMAWFEHGSSRIYFEAQGSGDPILLIPGLAGSIEEFSHLRDSLVMAGYQVIAADLPGSGRSEPRTYTASFFEEDTYAFAALLEHLESDPAHLVGFGNGGEVSLLMAELLPDIVRSVMAWGAVGTINDPGGELREAIYNVIDHPIPPLQKFRDGLVASYGEKQARAMTQSLVAAMSDIIECGNKLSCSKAEMITCPVFLIVGEHDIFAPPALAFELAGHIHTADVLVAQGVEHFAYIDQPEWLTRMILDWLAERTGQSQTFAVCSSFVECQKIISLETGHASFLSVPEQLVRHLISL
jgi:pimeloyl-ACP methyl ester carboxylesterase